MQTKLNKRSQKMIGIRNQKAGQIRENKRSQAVYTRTLAHRRLQDSTHWANTSAGHKSMQLSKEPPGQSDGVGEGEGDGGAGVGPGLGPGTVEPIGPNLMSEKMTCAFACLASTSAGTPEEVEHEPRAAPGSLESTGYVESNHNMLA